MWPSGRTGCLVGGEDVARVGSEEKPEATPAFPKLPPGPRSLTVFLREEDGTPVPTETVYVSSSSLPGPSARTGEDGTVRFSGLPAEPLFVSIGERSRAVDLTIADARIDFTLPPAVTAVLHFVDWEKKGLPRDYAVQTGYPPSLADVREDPHGSRVVFRRRPDPERPWIDLWVWVPGRESLHFRLSNEPADPPPVLPLRFRRGPEVRVKNPKTEWTLLRFLDGHGWRSLPSVRSGWGWSDPRDLSHIGIGPSRSPWRDGKWHGGNVTPFYPPAPGRRQDGISPSAPFTCSSVRRGKRNPAGDERVRARMAP